MPLEIVYAGDILPARILGGHEAKFIKSDVTKYSKVERIVEETID